MVLFRDHLNGLTIYYYQNNCERHMKKIFLILLFLLGNIIGFAQTDREIWTTFNASGNILEKLKIVLEREDRYSYKSNDIKYFHYDIGVKYKISNKTSVGLFYREIAAEEDFKIRLPQPHIDIFYKELNGFKFRTRLEYQMFNNMGLDLDNQIRLRLRPRWQFKFWQNYNPFIQNELFISNYVLTRNRYSMGITIKWKNLEIQPNYTLEMNNKSIWKDRHIVWINTKFKF